MSKFGYLKISMVSPFLNLANPKKNVLLISKIVRHELKKGVSIVVFPQLSVSGCSCGTLFSNELLVCETEKAVDWLVNDLKNLNVCCVIGMFVRIKNKLLNCAAVIFKGRVQGLVVKNEIFNSGVTNFSGFSFVEEFYFDKVCFNGILTPIGTNLIFKLDDAVFGIQFGLNFSGLEQNFLFNGVNLVFCLLASEFDGFSKVNQINLAKAMSLNLKSTVAFVNTGLFESSSECLYCGFAGFAEEGQLIKFKEQRNFNHLILNCDVDVLKFVSELDSSNHLKLKSQKTLSNLINLKFIANDFNFTRLISKTPYMADGVLNSKLYCLQLFKMQVMALARRVIHVKNKKLVVGVSGGLDSTLTLLVAVKVCKFLKKSVDFILAVFMPGFGTSKEAEKNVFNLVKNLGVDFKEISIKKACEQHFDDIGHDKQNLNVVFENAQARERMQILFDLANELDGLVLGTSDMSEIALGFSTYGGDSLAGYGVNCGICKTLVRKIVEYVAVESSSSLQAVLYDVLKMPISPELIKNEGLNDRAYQKTEEILGPYLLHDFFMFYFIKFGFSVKKIKFLAENAFADMFSQFEIEKALKVFTKRFFSQQFKRSCLPDGAKMMTFSMSPRLNLKLPSDSSVETLLDS